jgi:DNA replication protein DnaC
MNTPDTDLILRHLHELRLPWIRDNFELLVAQALRDKLGPAAFLQRLLDGETSQRRDRATQRRIAEARFPVLKTLEGFDWTWPKGLHRPLVEDLFRLRFLPDKRNIILLGGCGLGKTHLATALGYQACLNGHRVLFATAVEIVNNLLAAQTDHRLKTEIKRYLRPDLLILDELGYIPLDKHGADLLFQVVSQRYEQGSIILTSNKAFQDWPSIFHNDATVTSAILDRLLHHAETLILTGSSYRMKQRAEA